MKLFFAVLLVIFFLPMRGQQTIRKASQQSHTFTCGDISFTTSYEPYFTDRSGIKEYRSYTEHYYEFKNGKLLYLQVISHLGSNVTTYNFFETDLLQIDTNRLFTYSLNTYSGSGKKKVDNRGWELNYEKSLLCYSDRNISNLTGNKSTHMDFESYSQFIQFEKELKQEWYKALGELTHIKILKELEKSEIAMSKRPYLISLLNDSSFTDFKAALPYIKKAELSTEYKGTPMYNLIVILDNIKNYEGFINAYYEYDNNINVQDANGVSPLMLGVGAARDTSLVKFLLKMGASPFEKSKEAKTSYDYARELMKQYPAYERILREAILRGNYPTRTKLQFCDTYKLIEEGEKIIFADVQKYPDSLMVQYNRAAWKYNTKQYAQAVNAFTECIRLQKDNPAFYAYRGLSFYVLRMHEKAETDFAEAIRLDPDYKNKLEEEKKKKDAERQ